MYPESGVGLVGLGIVLLHQKEVVMAKALLHKGKQSFCIVIKLMIKTKKNDSDLGHFSLFGHSQLKRLVMKGGKHQR